MLGFDNHNFWSFYAFFLRNDLRWLWMINFYTNFKLTLILSRECKWKRCHSLTIWFCLFMLDQSYGFTSDWWGEKKVGKRECHIVYAFALFILICMKKRFDQFLMMFNIHIYLCLYFSLLYGEKDFRFSLHAIKLRKH